MRRHRVRLLRSRKAEGEKPEELSPEESAESVDAGEPDSQEQPELTANLLKRIVGYLKPYLMPTVLVCAVVIVNASIGLMPSIFTGKWASATHAADLLCHREARARPSLPRTALAPCSRPTE